MLRILVLISLCFGCSVSAKQPTTSITGSWKIVSYQIIGYPEMDEDERNDWLGNTINFKKEITLNNGKTSQTCAKFNHQVTTENSEAQFLTGYNVKPYKLGIIAETIEIIKITCQISDNWLKKTRWFAKISDVHMLGYWDGVLFFFVKQTNTDILLITPQSVGMINSKSPFDSGLLASLFPKYTLSKEFKLYQKNKLMLEVYSDNFRISHINIFDKNAIAPANAKIGMTYTEVFANYDTLIDCEAGVRELVGKTICSFKNLSTIKYIFQPQIELSPIEALEKAELVEFIWLAKPSLMEEEELPDRYIPKLEPAIVVDTQDTPINEENNESKQHMARLTDIKNAINLLLENSPNENLNAAMLDFNNTQQAWKHYSYKHCQWYATFLDIAEDICMEKMAKERADIIEIILYKLKDLSMSIKKE